MLVVPASSAVSTYTAWMTSPDCTVTVPAEYPSVSVIDILTSKSLLPIVTSARGPSSAAYAPADALNEFVLPAVNIVDVPVPLVCLIRIEPAEVVEHWVLKLW